MNLKPLSHVLGLATGLILAALISLLHVQHVGLAQGGIDMTKTLNKTGNVVRVGEVLSFTIALTNSSNFTLTGVTVVDTYDNTTLAFARAVPPPDLLNPATGVITWSNVATAPFPLPNIRPGQSVTITVVFTAEHPKPVVVNEARAQDLVSSMGALTLTTETSKTQEAIGGSAPVFKALTPDSTPQAGLPITFTQLITNDGAAMMTRLPLTDTYDPNFLAFKTAIPTPTLITPPGLLVWTDLTSDFGDIPPFGSVVVTTVFTAKTQVLTTVNQASTAGATDQFDNDLAGGMAQVPIIIIGPATPTPLPTPVPPTPIDVTPVRDDDDDGGDADRPVPAATVPAPAIQTPAANVSTGQTLTGTSETDTAPQYLPETGYRDGYVTERPPDFTRLGLTLVTLFAVLLFIWIIYRKR